MPSELDIHRAAWVLIQQHGSEAENVALDRAEDFLRLGFATAYQTWWAIKLAVAEQQRGQRPGEPTQ